MRWLSGISEVVIILCRNFWKKLEKPALLNFMRTISWFLFLIFCEDFGGNSGNVNHFQRELWSPKGWLIPEDEWREWRATQWALKTLDGSVTFREKNQFIGLSWNPGRRLWGNENVGGERRGWKVCVAQSLHISSLKSCASVPEGWGLGSNHLGKWSFGKFQRRALKGWKKAWGRVHSLANYRVLTASYMPEPVPVSALCAIHGAVVFMEPLERRRQPTHRT